jgi:hypothetical protein
MLKTHYITSEIVEVFNMNVPYAIFSKLLKDYTLMQVNFLNQISVRL